MLKVCSNCGQPTDQCICQFPERQNAFEELRFHAWLTRADEFLFQIAGTSHTGLADQPWHDWYTNEYTPIKAAKKALRREGW